MKLDETCWKSDNLKWHNTCRTRNLLFLLWRLIHRFEHNVLALILVHIFMSEKKQTARFSIKFPQILLYSCVAEATTDAPIWNATWGSMWREHQTIQELSSQHMKEDTTMICQSGPNQIRWTHHKPLLLLNTDRPHDLHFGTPILANSLVVLSDTQKIKK